MLIKVLAELWKIIEEQSQLIKKLTQKVAEQENLIDELLKG